MPLFGFKPRFVAPILDGIKDQTIRAVRKVPVRLYTPMYLYSGLRTSNAKRIGTALCIERHRIVIRISGEIWIQDDSIENAPIYCIDKEPELSAFALRDGFRDWPDMVAFWRAEHKGVDEFQGHVYRWDPKASGLGIHHG